MKRIWKFGKLLLTIKEKCKQMGIYKSVQHFLGMFSVHGLKLVFRSIKCTVSMHVCMRVCIKKERVYADREYVYSVHTFRRKGREAIN